jgi:hypothetical protein
MPYLNALAEFREAIRNLAIDAKNNNILAVRKICQKLKTCQKLKIC